MPQHPRCAAKLRDGSPCGRVTATPTSEFCSFHTEQFAPENLHPTVHRNPPKKRTAAMVVEPGPSTEIAAATTNNNGSSDPSTIRPTLARAAADHLPALQEGLLDLALNGSSARWVTVTCGACGQRSRVEVPGVDGRTRLAATEVLLSQGLGRAPAAPEITTAAMPRSAEAVARMDWEQLSGLAASIYVEEIAAVQRDGGAALVAEKIRALSDGERAVLRRALDAAEQRAAVAT
jgi:hypothetical protein